MLLNKPVRKQLPDPKSYPVLPPDMNYKYFENFNLFPFEFENSQYSPVNAWYMSEASFLAYAHPGFVEMAYRLINMNGFKFFGGKTTECFIAWNERYIILSFRGTEIKSFSAANEILTDLNAIMVDYPGGGKIHKGFLSAIEEIWSGSDGLESFVNNLIKKKPERSLWITGHSLGAALASIAFERFQNAVGLYLLGSPRIGNSSFADLFKGRAVYRIENAGDPIVRIPPGANKKNTFLHIGSQVYITDYGNIEFSKEALTLKNQKNEAVAHVNSQVSRTLSLTIYSLKKIWQNSYFKEKISWKRNVSPELLSEWETHFNDSSKEWSDYFVNLDKILKTRLYCHSPIFYSVKLWNALIL